MWRRPSFEQYIFRILCSANCPWQKPCHSVEVHVGLSSVRIFPYFPSPRGVRCGRYSAHDLTQTICHSPQCCIDEARSTLGDHSRNFDPGNLFEIERPFVTGRGADWSIDLVVMIRLDILLILGCDRAFQDGTIGCVYEHFE